MRYKRPKHHIEGLMTLILFGVFAACVLSVLLTGAKVYRDITAGNQQEFDQRTVSQFLAVKMRQAKAGSLVEVSDNAICFKESSGGMSLVTKVYCYDGWLWEIYTFDGWEYDPAAGEKIMPLQDMRVTLEEGLLTMDITDMYGQESRLVMSLRGGAAA